MGVIKGDTKSLDYSSCIGEWANRPKEVVMFLLAHDEIVRICFP